MQNAQIVICGAGVTGLTLARELLSRGADDILVLEKEHALGLHASGRNSGVLHAGVYYSPGTLKAKLCIQGNFLMRDFCKERGLPYQPYGKVIVAKTPEELPTLDELHRRATANGAGTRIIDEKELHEIEPYAATTQRAIHSPHTAVVDPKAILQELQKSLAATGKVRFMMGVSAIGRDKPNVLATTDGPVEFRTFINAAGAYADVVARMFGLGQGYALMPFMGGYEKLRDEKTHLVRGSIYPTPDIRNPFLGVHLTRGVSGAVYAGPTAQPVFGRENYHPFEGLSAESALILVRNLRLVVINPKYRAAAKEEVVRRVSGSFFRDAKALVPSLSKGDLVHCSKAGIRPQLVDLKTGELVMDFLIERGENSLHVLNAISPAFTSSMTFAKLAADELASTTTSKS
ncbi:MAG: (S)-2-hydroxyglutarate dehydrogenase [Desulfovibrionales bacterium]|jgi:L-2-hydroxyglutarate oxidase LhgO|nr:(S)-2-hydroxyglutarate dehydrogenase [Desulfovibrionales bacterium]